MNLHVELALGELLDGWAAHIRRFHDESKRSCADRDTWGTHDYVAALNLRDALERGLGLLGNGDRVAALQEMTELDQHFEALTEPDASALLRAYAVDGIPDTHWWWHRVPKRGPVREELDQPTGV
jgi:hypothetical protein